MVPSLGWGPISRRLNEHFAERTEPAGVLSLRRHTGTPRWIAVLFVSVSSPSPGLATSGYSVQSPLEADLAKAQDQNKLLTAQLDQANSRLADLKGHIEVTEQKMDMTQAELANARSRAEAIRKDQVAADQKLAYATEPRAEGKQREDWRSRHRSRRRQERHRSH